MGRGAVLLLALGLLAPAARAEVVVRVTGERVDVDATAAPLADVLDRLAGQTGMEIVYEGARPRQRVTLALQGRSPAEAVQGILEGQGLNYALVADPTGKRVQTLLLAGPVGKGTTPPGPAPRAPRIRRPVMPPGTGPEMMDPDFADMEDEEPFEDPELEEPFDDPLPPEATIPEGAVTAPPPGAGVLPFPGGQPQIYPASPFTPQPFSVPPDTTPPPGPPQEAPPQ
jgi:hypothetical protein